MEERLNELEIRYMQHEETIQLTIFLQSGKGIITKKRPGFPGLLK